MAMSIPAWTDGAIAGCTLTPLRKYADPRGWLGEFFRHDELPADLHPAMGYLSLTRPGVARGPHEHVEQTDLFLFFSGTFRLYLWDTREASTTYGVRTVVDVGEANPTIAIVPPGVVHAYRNIGSTEALVVNCPNRLYAGEGKRGPVDEIRHEEREGSGFVME
jgi:dTDP-4-dehydrorhamnose 3,5-epimerase